MYEAYQHGGMDWQQVFGRGATQTPGGWTVTFGGEGLEDLLGGGFSDFFKQFFGEEYGGTRRRGGTGADDLGREQGGRAPAGPSIAVTLGEAFPRAPKAVAAPL